jgi:hypothetical protein
MPSSLQRIQQNWPGKTDDPLFSQVWADPLGPE